MSRRQALGVISNNNTASAASNNALASKNPTKLVAKSTTTTTSIYNQLKSENEPPQCVLASLTTTSLTVASSACQLKKPASSSDFDFEIFQEEVAADRGKQQGKLVAKKSEANVQSDLLKFASKYVEKENSEVKRADKENLLKRDVEEKKQPVVVFETGEDEQDDYDEYEEEEEEDDDDETDDYDDEDDEAAEDLEEEGISRLNLAALIETSETSDKSSNRANTSGSELMNMMDSSSSTQNDPSSPMILDDTIKFQSHLSSSHYTEEEEDEEDEATDEETKRKQAVAERENLLMNCLEYKDDILSYMRELENEHRPKPSYMKKQADINSSMRSILVDWLVEVSEEYKLNAETLYLAVNYTDRFLSQMSVLRGKLQLVGTASMYIASKYEEISPPDVTEFVYITDDTYTKKQVLRMEHLLLKVLDFRMSMPTANYFLLHYLRFLRVSTGGEPQQRVESLAKYLAELTLIDGDTFLAYTPSQIAAAAVYLALHSLGKPWTKHCADTIGYAHDLSELRECVCDMHKFALQAAHHPQQAIQEKYKQAKHEYAALVEIPKTLPANFGPL